MAKFQDEDLTVLINKLEGGLPGEASALYAHLYDDIKKIANGILYRMPAGKTITPTVLVHETYEKFCHSLPKKFNDRQHLMRSLGMIMRHYILDVLRHKQAQKSGVPVADYSMTQEVGDDDIKIDFYDFHKALEAVSVVDPNHTQLIELKVLFGLTFQELGDLLEVSSRQVMRRWKVAKALLISVLNQPELLSDSNP
ncbi:ECF-type sigma factor [Marinicella meishanensis]|uniref:ECF-type sigma factor n=1 Tax=Marinicella meishanensis TaxID=2873263 RepID=UPI001CBE1B65